VRTSARQRVSIAQRREWWKFFGCRENFKFLKAAPEAGLKRIDRLSEVPFIFLL
jgi:hypothetical protein